MADNIVLKHLPLPCIQSKSFFQSLKIVRDIHRTCRPLVSFIPLWSLDSL